MKVRKQGPSFKTGGCSILCVFCPACPESNLSDLLQGSDFRQAHIDIPISSVVNNMSYCYQCGKTSNKPSPSGSCLWHWVYHIGGSYNQYSLEMIAFQHNEPAALYSYDPQSHEGSCILEDAYVYNIGDIICL